MRDRGRCNILFSCLSILKFYTSRRFVLIPPLVKLRGLFVRIVWPNVVIQCPCRNPFLLPIPESIRATIYHVRLSSFVELYTYLKLNVFGASRYALNSTQVTTRSYARLPVLQKPAGSLSFRMKSSYESSSTPLMHIPSSMPTVGGLGISLPSSKVTLAGPERGMAGTASMMVDVSWMSCGQAVCHSGANQSLTL